MGDPEHTGGDALNVMGLSINGPGRSWRKPLVASITKNRQGQPCDQNSTPTRWNTLTPSTKLMHYGRTIEGCHNEFAVTSTAPRALAPSPRTATGRTQRVVLGLTPNPKNETCKFPARETNPYQDEWEDLLDIRNDKPYNEAERGALASQVCNAHGRAHRSCDMG